MSDVKRFMVLPKKNQDEENAKIAVVAMNEAVSRIDKARKIDDLLVARTLLDFSQRQARRAKLDDLEKKVIDYRYLLLDKTGELLTDMKEKGEISQGGRPAQKTPTNLGSVSSPAKMTLEKLHITPSESSEAQKFHNQPKEKKKETVELEKAKVGTKRKRTKIVESPQPPVWTTGSGKAIAVDHIHVFNYCACGAMEGISE